MEDQIFICIAMILGQFYNLHIFLLVYIYIVLSGSYIFYLILILALMMTHPSLGRNIGTLINTFITENPDYKLS